MALRKLLFWLWLPSLVPAGGVAAQVMLQVQPPSRAAGAGTNVETGSGDWAALEGLAAWPGLREDVDSVEVDRWRLASPADVAALLDAAGGLRLQPAPGGLGGVEIRLLGLGGRYTELLQDGLPLRGTEASLLDALQLSPLGLERVELTEGTLSSRYGPGSIGGVVNLVSRQPDGGREALYRQTSLGATDAAVYWSGPAQPLSFTLAAGLHDQSMQDLDDDVWADVPAYRRVTLRPRAYWRGDRGNLLATVGTVWEMREGGTPQGERLGNNVQYRERLETRRADAGLNGSYQLNRRLRLGVRASLTRDFEERRLNNTATRGARSFALLESTLQGRFGAHRWLAGLSVERDSYAGYDLPLFSYQYSSPAVFVRDEFHAARELTFTGGARADFHSEFGTRFSPMVGASYQPGPWTVRLTGSTGWSAPGPFTELTEVLGFRTLHPLGGLKPERARSAGLELDRALGWLNLGARVFATTIDDPTQTRAPASNQLEVVNADGPLRAGGGEVSMRGRLSGLVWSASWLYLDATEANPDSAGKRRTVPLTPQRSAQLAAAWEFGPLGRLSGHASYTGEQSLVDNPFRTRSKPYWLLGLMAELALGRARLFLHGDNLLDVRQTRTDPLLRTTRSRAGLWTTGVWEPLAGRTWNGGVQVLLGHGH